ncbi:MAG: branched-chain amino acid ABC transporter permease [Rhodobacteraceae bacterium]|nr:MAG: branched-chain amino acid ABC transporter permease [Paracoccaceae bacterium]
MERLMENDALRGRLLVALTALIGVGVMFWAAATLEFFQIFQLTEFLILAILAISLAFIWGHGGILCFGQAAFFGLGGYAYALLALNDFDTGGALFLGVAIAGGFAALLGYFMFYGRLSDVYMGVVTLSVTLIFQKLMNSTAGSAYTVGKARLGGFNGIPSVPTLSSPAEPAMPLMPEQLYFVAFGALILVYLLLGLMTHSSFGRAAAAVRENETRAELIGYDVRRIKLVTFAIGGAVAGLAGALMASQRAFIDPNAFGLVLSAQALIWVIVGGLGTLVGPILGCIALQYLSLWLSEGQFRVMGAALDNNLVLGVILMTMVLAVPKGLAPTIRDGVLWLWRRARPSSDAPSAPAAAGERA